ncbi:hypothetical protein AHAS_Ahas15G0192700 [Arachis hypogaea]
MYLAFFIPSGNLYQRATPSIQVPHHSEILGLACQAFDIKWHAQPLLRSLCTLACHACVPRHVAQVARPYNCGLFKLGMPCLVPQVARPSDFLELACHAFDTKWHTIVKVLPGVMGWCVRRATPNLVCHALLVSSIVALWNFVLACHAQSLACHAHMYA